jgi:septal ring factor EnvC (AmiA/AmiB activator)
MISDADIEKLKEVFVTKEDLKLELSYYATKEDLNKAILASEKNIIEYVQVNIAAIYEEFGKVRAEMKEMKNEIKQIKEDIAHLKEMFYVFMDEIKALRIDVNNHEKRLIRLEDRADGKRGN